ncbi:MAG: hypothetical protein WAO51_07290 [Bacillota bacterium]
MSRDCYPAQGLQLFRGALESPFLGVRGLEGIAGLTEKAYAVTYRSLFPRR